jgi:hypothetical protein
MDDKFDATTVAIYFREENVTKKDPYFVYGTRNNTYFRGAEINSTEGVVDEKTIKFSIQEPLYYR